MDNTQNHVKTIVQLLKITEENLGQRLDNFLLTRFKGVPKTRIYRIIRKGEVRVNKGRIDNKYRLALGDLVRIPPIRSAARNNEVYLPSILKHNLQHNIIYEDDFLLVLNKLSGFAVHGGTGINSGIIESLRLLRPEAKFLELAHRLDKGTSGCLLVAKKRIVLKTLHNYFRTDGIKKTYLALLAKQWNKEKIRISVPLLKNIAKGGERFVKVSQSGKYAITDFKRLDNYKNFTLVKVFPKTGRTHQIRVHAAWLGHPVAGDDRYGNVEINKSLQAKGYKHMFLHAQQLQFIHPVTGDKLYVKSPLSLDLENFIKNKCC